MNQQKNNLPLVSVITPSYNQGRFIRETIESVLRQDYPNIEYIVVDGGSDDQTCAILKEYTGRLRWISERDSGQADAVNKGILMSHGEIIGWLNSDDIYEEGAVRKIVEYWRSHPDADMIYGDGLYIDQNGNVIGRYPTEDFQRKRLAEQCIICQPSAFFTRKIIGRIGLLDTRYQMGMDYELWMRISREGMVYHADFVTAASRMYGENKTLSRKKEAYEEACWAVKKNYGYVPAAWTRGYAFYLCGERRTVKFVILAIFLTLRFNLPGKGAKKLKKAEKE